MLRLDLLPPAGGHHAADDPVAEPADVPAGGGDPAVGAARWVRGRGRRRPPRTYPPLASRGGAHPPPTGPAPRRGGPRGGWARPLFTTEPEPGTAPPPSRRAALAARAGGSRSGVRHAGGALRVAVRDRGRALRAPVARGRRASRVQRQLVVEHAIAPRLGLALAASAARPGFVRAASRLMSELERRWSSRPRFEQALRAVGRRRAAAGARGEVAVAVRAPTATWLDAAGLTDDDLFARRAVEALRERPSDFGRTPSVRVRLRRLHPARARADRDAGRAGGSGCDGVAALRGRAAGVRGGAANLFERLRGLAERHVELPAISEWYAPESRARCTTSSAGCTGAARTASTRARRCGCSRRAASARRSSWSRRRCWRCCDPAPRPATLPSCSATRAATPR